MLIGVIRSSNRSNSMCRFPISKNCDREEGFLGTNYNEVDELKEIENKDGPLDKGSLPDIVPSPTSTYGGEIQIPNPDSEMCC